MSTERPLTRLISSPRGCFLLFAPFAVPSCPPYSSPSPGKCWTQATTTSSYATHSLPSSFRPPLLSLSLSLSLPHAPSFSQKLDDATPGSPNASRRKRQSKAHSVVAPNSPPIPCIQHLNAVPAVIRARTTRMTRKDAVHSATRY